MSSQSNSLLLPKINIERKSYSVQNKDCDSICKRAQKRSSPNIFQYTKQKQKIIENLNPKSFQNNISLLKKRKKQFNDELKLEQNLSINNSINNKTMVKFENFQENQNSNKSALSQKQIKSLNFLDQNQQNFSQNNQNFESVKNKNLSQLQNLDVYLVKNPQNNEKISDELIFSKEMRNERQQFKMKQKLKQEKKRIIQEDEQNRLQLFKQQIFQDSSLNELVQKSMSVEEYSIFCENYEKNGQNQSFIFNDLSPIKYRKTDQENQQNQEYQRFQLNTENSENSEIKCLIQENNQQKNCQKSDEKINFNSYNSNINLCQKRSFLSEKKQGKNEYFRNASVDVIFQKKLQQQQSKYRNILEQLDIRKNESSDLGKSFKNSINFCENNLYSNQKNQKEQQQNYFIDYDKFKQINGYTSFFKVRDKQQPVNQKKRNKIIQSGFAQIRVKQDQQIQSKMSYSNNLEMEFNRENYFKNEISQQIMQGKCQSKDQMLQEKNMKEIQQLQIYKKLKEQQQQQNNIKNNSLFLCSSTNNNSDINNQNQKMQKNQVIQNVEQQTSLNYSIDKDFQVQCKNCKKQNNQKINNANTIIKDLFKKSEKKQTKIKQNSNEENSQVQNEDTQIESENLRDYNNQQVLSESNNTYNFSSNFSPHKNDENNQGKYLKI
ncbi:hypothetical protein PPERSA_00571 [Pseudocohnilembus persalinus]|uniref:Uncharacterized protein n=1 Tax=Pseudocohnilembus persalinus TaxID=266149 RepID=A0A0V0QSQ0_PSEPJ|nr:hypothetical protein PPERSA_00571 [Pseudocohnilembus persalinus]|eukprot:KRX05270.1 hypothetical protein PPERSA_00571 [Pseudocohnilembus persalinus]